MTLERWEERAMTPAGSMPQAHASRNPICPIVKGSIQTQQSGRPSLPSQHIPSFSFKYLCTHTHTRLVSLWHETLSLENPTVALESQFQLSFWKIYCLGQNLPLMRTIFKFSFKFSFWDPRVRHSAGIKCLRGVIRQIQRFFGGVLKKDDQFLLQFLTVKI